MNFIDRDFDERDYELLLQLDEYVPNRKIATENEMKKIEKRLVTSDDLNERCSICLVDLELGDSVKELPCNHIFHPDCIDKWLKEYNHICPICKQTISDSLQVKQRQQQQGKDKNKKKSVIVDEIIAINDSPSPKPIIKKKRSRAQHLNSSSSSSSTSSSSSNYSATSPSILLTELSGDEDSDVIPSDGSAANTVSSSNNNSNNDGNSRKRRRIET